MQVRWIDGVARYSAFLSNRSIAAVLGGQHFENH
jgi:hypothetical protein